VAGALLTTLSSWSGTYDNLGRITGSSQSFFLGDPTIIPPGSGAGTASPTQTFAYGYTNNGLLNGLTLTVGSNTDSLAYGFDNLNRTTSVTQTADGRTLQVGIGYQSDGRVGTLTRSRGATVGSLATVTTATFGYQSDGQLTSLTHTNAAATTLTQLGWTYDNNHRVSQKSYTRTGGPSTSHTYGYDGSGQINLIDSVAVPYDANGNTGAAGTTVGTFNQLTSDASFTYTYDNEGHRATRTANAGVTGVPAFTAYTYDNRGRLVTVTDKTSASGVNVQQELYNYDVLNRKVGETVIAYNGSGTETGRVSTGYVYDGNQIIEQLDASGNVTRTNLWGPGTDHLMASDLGSGTTAITVWPLFDEQGTVRDLYWSNEATTGAVYQIGQSLTFDDYGKVTGTTDETLTGGQSAIPQTSFGTYFAGHQLDVATGLYDDRARNYDASTHQFTEQDPSGFSAGDTNLYRYVGNSPANYTDPSGLDSMWYAGASAFVSSLATTGYYMTAGVVTGETGAMLGARAVAITEQSTNQPFSGSTSDWGTFGRALGGELAGSNALAESGVGVDLATSEALSTEDRVQRGLAGFGETVLIVTPVRITSGVVSKGLSNAAAASRAASRTVSRAADGLFLEPPANPAALQIRPQYLQSMQPRTAPVPLVPSSPIPISQPPLQIIPQPQLTPVAPNSVQTPHTISPSRPGRTGTPNSIYEKVRPDGGRSVTYFDDTGRAFSREDYGQLTPHRTIRLGPDGRAMPHEHMTIFGDRGPIGNVYRAIDQNGMPIGPWIPE
jgi:RHS repeat-associated protein